MIINPVRGFVYDVKTGRLSEVLPDRGIPLVSEGVACAVLKHCAVHAESYGRRKLAMLGRAVRRAMRDRSVNVSGRLLSRV
jgi:hypothetical protein